MDRRSLLVAASAGLVVPSLFAVPSFAAEDEGGSAAIATYKKNTLIIGTFSKKISEMAVQKVKHPRLKDFADYEIAEQTAVAEVLTNELDPAPPTLLKAQQEMVEKLGGETGESFEKMYIAAEIKGHEELRELQNSYLQAHGLKNDLGHIARLAKAVIDMHLSMLHELHESIG